MIQEFVDIFIKNKEVLKEQYRRKFPGSYTEIVKSVIELLTDRDEYCGVPDPNRITVIDDGDYQGTLLYIIGEVEYQPSTYWRIFVDYGSCSVCDTYDAICSNSSWDGDNEIYTEQQIDDIWTLALHIVQNMKEI